MKKVIIENWEDCNEVDRVCENYCGKEDCHIAGYCKGATKKCDFMKQIWDELGYDDE